MPQERASGVQCCLVKICIQELTRQVSTTGSKTDLTCAQQALRCKHPSSVSTVFISVLFIAVVTWTPAAATWSSSLMFSNGSHVVQHEVTEYCYICWATPLSPPVPATVLSHFLHWRMKVNDQLSFSAGHGQLRDSWGDEVSVTPQNHVGRARDLKMAPQIHDVVVRYLWMAVWWVGSMLCLKRVFATSFRFRPWS